MFPPSWRLPQPAISAPLSNGGRSRLLYEFLRRPDNLQETRQPSSSSHDCFGRGGRGSSSSNVSPCRGLPTVTLLESGRAPPWAPSPRTSNVCLRRLRTRLLFLPSSSLHLVLVWFFWSYNHLDRSAPIHQGFWGSPTPAEKMSPPGRAAYRGKAATTADRQEPWVGRISHLTVPSIAR